MFTKKLGGRGDGTETGQTLDERSRQTERNWLCCGKAKVCICQGTMARRMRVRKKESQSEGVRSCECESVRAWESEREREGERLRD